MSTPRVLISILNWNKAAVTLACLDALRRMERGGMTVDVVVMDNGSDAADYQALRDGIDPSWVELVRRERNLGFTGGHNVVMQIALDKDYDFVWLLNNDATVAPDTLLRLAAVMAADPRCGAVSPVICSEDGAVHDGWGITLDWKARSNANIASAASSRQMQDSEPQRVGLVGTALMFRVQALREVGLLDDRLFAYWEDVDISVRMARGGWHNKVAFDTTATHDARTVAEQRPYFFYLMFRNELMVWHKHMPREHRKLLWLKLVNQALYKANRLRRDGFAQQADSALLGTWDFMTGRHGAFSTTRKPPAAIRLLSRLMAVKHDKQLRATQVRSASAG